MLLFILGFVAGGIVVAIVLNNIHSTQVKALEAKIDAKVSAVTNAVKN